MKLAVVLLGGIMALPVTETFAEEPGEQWSPVAGGLQVRLVLVERPKKYGTRWLVPYLELRNVSDSAAPLQVRCGDGHVKFELVDAEGKEVRSGWSLPRSGPHPDPGTITLPFDSSMRLGMSCTNWGIPQNSAAMISTDSGAWVLQPAEHGQVFLRLTLQGKQDSADGQLWHGTLVPPVVKIVWSE